jgi:nucleotide-binding universal stress UspA family protein
MTTKIVIGLDGHGSGDRALAYGKQMAKLIGDCELIIVYVIEWSPYSFQTPEENAERHKRREEEIQTATDRIVAPAVEKLKQEKIKARGIVRHGHVANILEAISVEESAQQIIIARTSENGLAQRLFGTASVNLVMHASVPVTVIG